MKPAALGRSPYPDDDYTRWRWLHYGEQVEHVLRLQPRRVLEVGPGDHTVGDFLARKGIEVESYDRDPELRPTYVGDIREPLVCDGGYDVVLASEILEHMPYDESLSAARRLVDAVRPGGALVLSMPYTTVRLFPRRARYGRVASPEGRVHTGVPVRWGHRVLWLVGMARALVRGDRARVAGRPGRRPVDPDDHEQHHWDLGDAATSIARVRADLDSIAPVEQVDVRRGTNCVFFTLRRPA